MNVQTNSAISVDCVIFGFDGTDLKALLVRRRNADPLYDEKEVKLPGAMILENETLEEAASRVLEATTGLKGLYLKQIAIFSNPNRVTREELDWICEYHGISTDRVVTVGYYALVKLGKGMTDYTRRQGAQWMNVDEIHSLIMDHMDILSCCHAVSDAFHCLRMDRNRIHGRNAFSIGYGSRNCHILYICKIVAIY